MQLQYKRNSIQTKRRVPVQTKYTATVQIKYTATVETKCTAPVQVKFTQQYKQKKFGTNKMHRDRANGKISIQTESIVNLAISIQLLLKHFYMNSF